MKFRIIVSLFLVTSSVCVSAQSFCNMSSTLCPNGASHIACENNGDFAEGCPMNAKAMNLSDGMKTLIVHMHNVRRNRIASGNLAGFSQAKRMPTIKWDDQLARVALWNAKRCFVGHDECRNTPTYKRSGQNIGMTGTPAGTPNLLYKHLITVIQQWFGEFRDATMNDINNFRHPRSVNDFKMLNDNLWISNRTIGHFAMMVNDRVVRLGCGTVRFMANKRNRLITTCNYSSTNIFNNTVYKTGAVASECKSGNNPNYSNLCSDKEDIDANAI